ncbi:hypothetical protein NUITMVP1_12980 [Proteus mirabilis]|nr:hypothetical protein NUITMVP1_12980 [Proteus mirabilis]SPY94290.1 ribosome modulation factor [Proteus mirabilis]
MYEKQSLSFRLNLEREGCLNMKRQKRDRLARALSKGYQAGMQGRSKEQCPYFAIDARSHWLGGWRQAMEDRPGLAK